MPRWPYLQTRWHICIWGFWRGQDFSFAERQKVLLRQHPWAKAFRFRRRKFRRNLGFALFSSPRFSNFWWPTARKGKIIQQFKRRIMIDYIKIHKKLPNENDLRLQICFGPPKFQLNQTIFCPQEHQDFENRFLWEWHTNHTMNFLNYLIGCKLAQHFLPDCRTCCIPEYALHHAVA